LYDIQKENSADVETFIKKNKGDALDVKFFIIKGKERLAFF
jgi:hypothetical protein